MSLEGERKASRKTPWYQDVDGCRIPGLFSPEAFRSAMSYKPRSDDLFIVTFPKCGTTWEQNIVASIFKEGRPFESALEFFSDTPFLEMVGAKAGEELKRPAALKMHLPFYKMPSSSEAKYIYLARNPKFKMANDEENKILPDYKNTGYGLKVAGFFSLEAFKSALEYKPRSDDLFIVTYPKCGTTWVQNIVGCIFKEGKPFTSAIEFVNGAPFLEMAGAEAAQTMKRPGAIKLHLPFHLAPYSKEAKYIFVARNPKDCVVSFFHHTRNIVGYKFKNGTFDDYFELFMKGEVDFGDYFDCLLSWYEHRSDPNVLFITYEQLKEDTRTYILKIAEFMGQKYKDMLVNDEKLLDDVIKHSSFSFTKEIMNKKYVELAALPRDVILNHPDLPQAVKDLLLGKESFFDQGSDSVTHVRKGVIGDWRNFLSPEQNQRLNKKFEERTKGTDIPELWKDYMA